MSTEFLTLTSRIDCNRKLDVVGSNGLSLVIYDEITEEGEEHTGNYRTFAIKDENIDDLLMAIMIICDHYKIPTMYKHK